MTAEGLEDERTRSTFSRRTAVRLSKPSLPHPIASHAWRRIEGQGKRGRTAEGAFKKAKKWGSSIGHLVDCTSQATSQATSHPLGYSRKSERCLKGKRNAPSPVDPLGPSPSGGWNDVCLRPRFDLDLPSLQLLLPSYWFPSILHRLTFRSK